MTKWWVVGCYNEAPDASKPHRPRLATSGHTCFAPPPLREDLNSVPRLSLTEPRTTSKASLSRLSNVSFRPCLLWTLPPLHVSWAQTSPAADVSQCEMATAGVSASQEQGSRPYMRPPCFTGGAAAAHSSRVVWALLEHDPQKTPKRLWTEHASRSASPEASPSRALAWMPSAPLAERVTACVVIIAVSAILLYVISFAHSTTLHNAAHDVRHAFAFPCH